MPPLPARLPAHPAICPSCPRGDPMPAAFSSRLRLWWHTSPARHTPQICGRLMHAAPQRTSPPTGDKSTSSWRWVSGDFFPVSSPLLSSPIASSCHVPHVKLISTGTGIERGKELDQWFTHLLQAWSLSPSKKKWCTYLNPPIGQVLLLHYAHTCSHLDFASLTFEIWMEMLVRLGSWSVDYMEIWKRWAEQHNWKNETISSSC